ncbi:uncharacterized protein LOC105702366 [Orussus abietinus]|uniref:uncharacterized protein LOC105702366 n=1 Tax=Orussus abietinus TaxID=222816 RepID=UPI00062604F7|nr:uncharacterized protein LOC105702366 [Orussus abietinus]
MVSAEVSSKSPFCREFFESMAIEERVSLSESPPMFRRLERRLTVCDRSQGQLVSHYHRTRSFLKQLLRNWMRALHSSYTTRVLPPLGDPPSLLKCVLIMFPSEQIRQAKQEGRPRRRESTGENAEERWTRKKRRSEAGEKIAITRIGNAEKS